MKTRIKQHDITDCGAACLAAVAAHYRLQLPIARIRQYANTDKKGTNVAGMITAAEKLGFSAKGVKGPFESLFKIPRPAIAHVIVKEVLHHYMVIFNVTKKYVEVMDPADGKMHRLAHAEFKAQWTGVLILLLPNEYFMEGREKTTVLQRCWFLIRPHRAVMAQALFGAVIYTVIGLSTAVYVQKIVDFVLVEGNINLLNLMSVVMIALLLLQVFMGSVKTAFILKTGQRIDARLILGYYKHLLKLPQQFFDTMRVGEIISRVNDAVKIRIFINDVALSIAVDVFIVVFSFVLMFTYFWKLALIILTIIPFYLLIYSIINKVNKRVQRKLMENAAELESQLVESLHAVATIKRFGLEQHAGIKTETRFIALLRTIYTSGINSLYAGNSTAFITRLFTIILLWAGSYFVIGNQLTPGELLSFYALIGYFTGPAGGLIGMNKTLQDALIAADRLFEIMDLEREETENKIELTREMIGDIRFEEVGFRYGSRVAVFENLQLTIPKGRITGIVGESGSGKSTLIDLLQHIYSLNTGNITIGGYNIKHISNSGLRSMIGVVPQQTDLFAGNFIENIAIGDYEPDMKKILTICSHLGMTGFIEDIPAGFHAEIGENGICLSGGQKQRLAIARALYKEPEILILDEATASLDSISEQYVQKAIRALRKEGKTIIIIAHRLSTLKQADKIIVLDKGKVAEEGLHEELLSKRQSYFRLWERQHESFT